MPPENFYGDQIQGSWHQVMKGNLSIIFVIALWQGNMDYMIVIPLDKADIHDDDEYNLNG